MFKSIERLKERPNNELQGKEGKHMQVHQAKYTVAPHTVYNLSFLKRFTGT